MLKHAKNILAEVLELTSVERTKLEESPLSSFEFQSRKAIDALWAQEVEDRIDAFESNKMTAIPAKDVFAEIEKKADSHENRFPQACQG